MMKRFISLAVAFCMMFMLCGVSIDASDEDSNMIASGTFGMDGDNLTWVLDGSGTLTISGTGAMGESIGEGAPWYRYGESISNVKIEDGVTDIGPGAFGRGYSLEDDFIYSYPYLTSIDIPDSVTSIGRNAFTFCTGLTSIDIPDSVTSIGWGAFEECESLRSITIPDGVTLIDNNVFGGCDSLESIEIPDSVTLIGIGAFHHCDNLKSITIPDSVTSIGECAFSGCFNLESITIPEGVTSIGEEAFAYCYSLTSIIIPASVTLIGEDAFEYCTSLETVYVPEGLDVSSASIPEGANVIKYTYIGECGDNLIWTLDDNGTLTISGTGAMADYLASGAAPWAACRSSIEKVVIASGVTSIGNYAFGSCKQLISIEIPDSVKSIGVFAFYECSILESVTIPDSVTSIGDDAFYYCTSLTSITIPDSVTSIGGGAFFGCSSLTSITIPGSVKSIGSSAFFECTSLTSVTIPESVTSIGYNVFIYCRSLKTVYVPEGLDVSSASIPSTSAVIKYAVDNDKVTITEITTVNESDTVPIPETLNGYEVVAVKEEYWDKVGEHTERVGTATCTAKAFCSLCGKEYGEYGAHIVETIPAVPATCTETGLTEGKQCSVCGAIITAQEEVPATGHSWDEGVITTQPTASADGVKTYTCTVCGVTETEAVPATGEQSQPETPSKPQTPTHTQATGASSAASEKEENVPSINGDNGKRGWQAISDEISGTAAGGTVTVDMNGATELPKNITEEIAGKDIDLVLDMGGGISWTINGLSVTTPKTVDLSVSSGTENIPVDVINRVSGENYTIQISLAYDGEFGFTARLSIDLGTKNDGLYANLFYYNDAEKLEFIDSSIIENGVASIDFTHASDYAIVIDNEPFGAYEDVSAAAGVLAGDDVILEGKAVPTAAVIIVSLIAAAYALSGKSRRRKR